MTISTVDVFLLDLPLVEPFAASHGTTSSRTVTMVRVGADGREGWGECSALPAATYSAESAVGCYHQLVDDIGPDLLGGHWPDGDLGPLTDRYAHSPMALAAVEMALLDLELTTAGTPLARWLGATAATVPAGASLGLDAPEAVVDRARDLVAQGYRRLKVKIQPGHDRQVVERIRADPEMTATAVELQLDANGAYGPDDLDLLVSLVDRGADVLEQPLAPTDVAASAELVDRLAGRAVPVPVVADESVGGLADANRLSEAGAITGISIKPARVGGLRVAGQLNDLCRARGLHATAGGMLETGLGRHALAALAARPGFDLIGDLSPAARWLAADPWPDLALVDGRIEVPTGPGVAPAPDLDLLRRHTLEHRSLGADAGRDRR